MIIRLLCIFLFLANSFGSTSLFCQSITPVVVASGGGFYDDGTNSLSYTVGELITKTYSDGSNFLTQGFQQPSPYVIVSTPDLGFVSKIKFYPNPFNYSLSMSISTPEDNLYQIAIYNIQGKLSKTPIQLSQSFGEQVYDLDVEGLANGIYIVRVTEQNGKKHSEFKLIRM